MSLLGQEVDERLGALPVEDVEPLADDLDPALLHPPSIAPGRGVATAGESLSRRPVRKIGGLATGPKSTAESSLQPFSEPVRRWFEASFEAPTPAQAMGWPKIVSGANTLICAPTGSGKTLAAFLWGIDRLGREPERLGQGVKIVYVSPLKALSYDIERNLRAPLKGIGAEIAVGAAHRRHAPARAPGDAARSRPTS